MLLGCCKYFPFFFFSLHAELSLAPKGCVFVVYTRFFALPWGPSVPRNYKVVNYGEFWRDHISRGAIFRELQLSLGECKVRERVKVSGGALARQT